jgi:DNA modification methylase
MESLINNMETYENQLFLGDSLEQIRKRIPDLIIDLIYIDVPFFTQTTQKTASHQYRDIWTSFEDYLEYIGNIIKESYRKLKKTGSLYLHCDYRASHYLKIICDEIFGVKNFRNEVIWKRSKSSNQVTSYYGVLTDSIFFYSKSNHYTFNTIYIPLSQEQIKRDYRYIEKESGRRFSTFPLLRGGESPKTLLLSQGRVIKSPKGKRFIWSQDTLNEFLKKNPKGIVWTKNNNPRYKKYADEHIGVPLNNLWLDIDHITATSKKENLDYPNQKPEKLLKRIIKISSNEEELVADFFCGSGTTLAIAQKLNRKWIGIDNNKDAIDLCKKRLSQSKISDYY